MKHSNQAIYIVAMFMAALVTVKTGHAQLVAPSARVVQDSTEKSAAVDHATAPNRPLSAPAEVRVLRPIRQRKHTQVSGGTGLTTNVTVSRNGRVDGVNELHRWGRLRGGGGMVRLVVNDRNGNVLYASEIFRGSTNPGSRRVESFHRRLPVGVTRAAHTITIEHYKYSSGNVWKRAGHMIRVVRETVRDNPEILAAATGN